MMISKAARARSDRHLQTRRHRPCFLGAKFIVAAFVVGAFGSVTLGIFTLLRSQSTGAILVGMYLVSLRINYLPLLFQLASMFG
jgi:hypothetical protein